MNKSDADRRFMSEITRCSQKNKASIKWKESRNINLCPKKVVKVWKLKWRTASKDPVVAKYAISLMVIY